MLFSIYVISREVRAYFGHPTGVPWEAVAKWRDRWWASALQLLLQKYT